VVKQSTKETIIEKANELFQEKGYENVTIIDICEACGISKTTFYYHIKSKEEIILRFYDKVTHNISVHLLSMLSKDNYFEQLLSCFYSLISESQKYGTDFFSQMLISNLKYNYGSYDFRDELTEVAVMIIKKAQDTGQIRNQNNPYILYRAAAFGFFGHEVTWCIKNGEHSWKEYVAEELTAIFDVAEEFRIS